MYKHFLMIDNGLIRKLMVSQCEKRALSIYIYISYMSGSKGYTFSSISEILWGMGMKNTSTNKSSLMESMSILDSLGMVRFYNDRYMDEPVITDQLPKLSGKPFVLEPTTCMSSHDFSLIPYDCLDNIVLSNSEIGISDMIVSLSYFCMVTERRKNVIPVSWGSMSHISENIHMKDNKLSKIIKELSRLKVLYVRKIKLNTNGFDREHNIYGLYKESDMVDTFCSRVLRQGSINKNLKYGVSSSTKTDENVAVILEGNDFVTDVKLSKMLDMVNFDWNTASARVINDYQKKHGMKNLVEKVGENIWKIVGSDNGTGYIMSILKED